MILENNFYVPITELDLEEETKMNEDETLDIALAIDELIKDTEVYSVVRWQTKDTNIYQLLDDQGKEIDLIELEK